VKKLTTLLHRKPWVIALTLFLLLLLWMLTGLLGGKSAKQEAPNRLEKSDLTLVRVQPSQAEQVARVITLQGKTEADRRSKVRSEISGKVEKIMVKRGEPVAAGQILIQLTTEDRLLRLQKAKASLKQRELEYSGAKKLRSQGLNAQTKLAEAEANLELARAELEDAKLALEKTKIRAPYAGIFNERYVEVGDYVSVSSEVGEIIDVQPVVVRVDVPEKEFTSVHLGQQGTATLLTGQQFSGKVRYLSSASDDATHTFRVELAIENPAQDIPVGLSATVKLHTEQVLAHKISPALLTLGDNGGLGVKVVDADNRVHFKPVQIVYSEADGTWVAGLNEKENIITVGQGFVSDGDEVKVDRVTDKTVEQGEQPNNIVEQGGEHA